MRFFAKSGCALILSCFLMPVIKGQDANPYHLRGSATQDNCHCYTLTQDLQMSSGSMWNKTKIDLNQPFDFKFEIFLGCNDSPGADGIVFVLQPISTEVGTTGEGMGFEGIYPSIGIPVDTYRNFNRSDPYYDNISIHSNGNVDNFANPDLLSPPVSATANENIEDCEWHSLRIIWNPAGKHLQAEVDGVLRVQTTKDLINDIFHGDPMVYWGFTGATGGETNLQKVCTSLSPSFYLPKDQKTCFPQPITFIDSSRSFGSIVKWYWDFGDGTTFEGQAPPVHSFPSVGKYDVKLAILGNDGCLSDTFTKTIVAGSKPVADFQPSPLQVCDGTPTTLTDRSVVEFGTINTWNWIIADSIVAVQNPKLLFPPGTTAISLQVETQEGCISETVSKTIESFKSPIADFSFDPACLSEPSEFTAENKSPDIPLRSFEWDFGYTGNDSRVSVPATTRDIGHVFPVVGNYNVDLFGVAENGCPSPTVSYEVSIKGTKANAGNDTLVAQGQPLQLSGSGGEIYKWSPSTGLNADNIANPVAILNTETDYILTTSIVEGCFTSDTVNVKVYKGPTVYVPSGFTPNNDGKNDRFRFLAVGMVSIDFFQVFNRYGQRVFASNDLKAEWDGMLNGTAQPAGTYVWMIRGHDYQGNVHTKKGTVVLIR